MKKQQHIQDSEPLRTAAQIDIVRSLIKVKTKEPLRNRLIFDIGINNGIRTNDILRLKVDDVVDANGKPKASTTIIESKTGKKRVLRFNESIQNQLATYLDQRGSSSDWLFASYHNPQKPITTQAIYRMFSRIKQGQPLLKGLTAHSMRRTFGYHFYKQTHDVVTLMKIFNHSSQAITLRYIGIEKEDIDKELSNFSLWFQKICLILPVWAILKADSINYPSNTKSPWESFSRALIVSCYLHEGCFFSQDSANTNRMPPVLNLLHVL